MTIDLESLAARLDRVETELALHRLVHDYCIAADHRDAQRWDAVWTHDAVWETSPDRVYRGTVEIRRAVEVQWATFPAMQHATSNHIVDRINGDTAAGRCDAVVLVQLPDLRWIVGGGAYEDEYRREDDRWRIARRTVVRPFDLAPLAASNSPILLDEDD
ncbi:nuclear transport factor 2 family protein [Actinospica robiniae]|uniref:nuclear transport factor 2 family protein n=1 Tax=Actinospica robiniae TaxID=304901 RepID=UPI00040CF435|nr:nuclear transport factor 2 family protein [Actinospica robiniae]